MIRATMAGLVILVVAAWMVATNTQALATCQLTQSFDTCTATLK